MKWRDRLLEIISENAELTVVAKVAKDPFAPLATSVSPGIPENPNPAIFQNAQLMAGAKVAKDPLATLATPDSLGIPKNCQPLRKPYFFRLVDGAGGVVLSTDAEIGAVRHDVELQFGSSRVLAVCRGLSTAFST